MTIRCKTHAGFTAVTAILLTVTQFCLQDHPQLCVLPQAIHV
jgi:hypothetical protein